MIGPGTEHKQHHHKVAITPQQAYFSETCLMYMISAFVANIHQNAKAHRRRHDYVKFSSLRPLLPTWKCSEGPLRLAFVCYSQPVIGELRDQADHVQ